MGREQDCVTCTYIVVARTQRAEGRNGGGITFEAPDHALGRLLQRNRDADPAAAMWEANEVFMAASFDAFKDCTRTKREFYLPTTGGAFLCEPIASKDPNGRLMLHARARTWLASDMLRPDQVPIPIATETDEDPPMLVSIFMRLMMDGDE
jgi:hypothetical protein